MRNTPIATALRFAAAHARDALWLVGDVDDDGEDSVLRFAVGRDPHRAGARLAGPVEPEGRRVISKYIITDMYAKAVQGMPAEDAVKWAHAELVKVYASR